MKKILLVFIGALFLTGCSSNWYQEADCLSSIPVAEQSGIKSALQIVSYSEWRVWNWDRMQEDTHSSSQPVSSCQLTCESNYKYVHNTSGPRCLLTQAQCSESELPANAVNGYKTLLSNGTYGVCQVIECASGYSVQSDNTCGSTVITPPPVDPCIINPSGPLCMPPIPPP